MPKYEYACKSCGERLEVRQSFTDAALTECPACGGPLRKVFSAPAITFKGSGFYRTDHGKGRPTESKGEAKPAASDGKSSETKSEPAKAESKPAADTKPKATEAKTA
jgi:putative FmdB family regulatory protein